MNINYFGLGEGEINFSGNFTINNFYVKNEAEKKKYLSMKNLKIGKITIFQIPEINVIINDKKAVNVKHEYITNDFE